MARRHLLVAAALAARIACAAEAVPDLAPSVANVVSGGQWEHEHQRGHYRVVVRTAGWEHVSSTIRVEWIVEDPDEQRERVLVSLRVDAIPDWAWSLGRPELTSGTSGARVTIGGTHHQTLKRARWRIDLRGPSQITVFEITATKEE